MAPRGDSSVDLLGRGSDDVTAYPKNPMVDYNISDEENIRAIANHLEKETSNVVASNVVEGPPLSSIVEQDEPPDSSLFRTLEAMRTDCIWSPEPAVTHHEDEGGEGGGGNHHNLKEGITKLTEELLDGGGGGGGVRRSVGGLMNNMATTLNSSTVISTSDFHLTPTLPPGGGHNSSSGSFRGHTNGLKYLPLQRATIGLLHPNSAMVQNTIDRLKQEPLSPHPIEPS